MCKNLSPLYHTATEATCEGASAQDRLANKTAKFAREEAGTNDDLVLTMVEAD
jgi:hypothetical protein